ncbi:MAG TPA: TRAP transporter large permease [Thermoanaerobaculia bacterium]|nr:TRAP transporter large permease [Thermoanaerobaculia bacterium]
MDVAAALAIALVLVVLLAFGVPVAAALALAAVAGLLGSVPALPALTTVAQRMATGIDSFVLLAIPLFVLSGQLLNRGGAAARLVELGRCLVARLPAGLAWVTVLGSLLFGAISGSAVASAAAIGSVMVPQMEREGYHRGFSAAVNLTAATTGLLVPPSNILIVYGLAAGGVSITALFLAGYVPGLLLGLTVALVATVTARRHGFGQTRVAAPGLAEMARLTARALPTLILVVLVMGGIVAGWFTATEAAGVSVAYALVLGVAVHRELRLVDVPRVVVEAAATTGVVMLLIAGSIALSWTLAFADVPQAIGAALLETTSQPLALLLILNLCLLILGTVLDMTPAVLLFTPIFLPVLQSLGVDPVHFGIVLVLNLCVGLCTPPVGTVLFVGLGTANVTLRTVLPYLVPLYVAMLVALLLVTLVPELSLWLPRTLGAM